MSGDPYYSDEFTTVYLADCLDVLASLEPQSVDAVLTDPPYSSGGRRENARSIRRSMLRETSDEEWIRGDAMSTNGFTWLMRSCGLQWRRLLVPGGHALSFIDWRMWPTLAAALESADLRQHPAIVWDKAAIGMGTVFRNQHEFVVHMSAGNPREPYRRDVANVLRYAAVRNGTHPTEKPEPLLRTLLSVVATEGQLVLDPFAGSGSTLAAARSLGMRSIGVEADERFAEQIAKRFDQTTLDFGALAP